jgi:hypothetical protein
MKKIHLVFLLLAVIVFGGVWYVLDDDQPMERQLGLADRVQPIESLAGKIERTTFTYEPQPIRNPPPPLVDVNLESFEINLDELYWADSQLAKLAAGDKKFVDWKLAKQNGSRVIKTSIGEFQIVSCFDRQSTDPLAKNSGGMRYDMVKFPGGKWLSGWPAPFTIERVLEVEGKVFLITSQHVCAWISPQRLRVVATCDPYTGYLANTNDPQRIVVYNERSQDREGLLEYKKESWVYRSPRTNTCWTDVFTDL